MYRRRTLTIIVAVIAIGAFLTGFFLTQVLGYYNNTEVELNTQGEPNRLREYSSLSEPFHITKKFIFGSDDEKSKVTLCVYDEFSGKAMKNVRIYVNGDAVGRTSRFGCSVITPPEHDDKHTILLKGRNAVGTFTHIQTLNGVNHGQIHFYLDLYKDDYLRELAHKLINEYRAEYGLGLYGKGNDVNAQIWAAYLHREMMTSNGMMENAQAQIVNAYGYISKTKDVVCTNGMNNCPPAYYTYSCKENDCAIERGYAVKTLVDGIAHNELFKTNEFRYVSIGISYDSYAMFLVVNFHK